MELLEWLRARLDEDEAYVRDPRGLADLASKRAILGLHHPDGALENWYWLNRKCAGCQEPWHQWLPDRQPTDIGPEKGCQTVRLLALPYACNPGYDEAWRPDSAARG